MRTQNSNIVRCGIFLFAALWLAPLFVHAQQINSQGRLLVEARYTKAPPTIDGVVKADEWSGAQVHTVDFATLGVAGNGGPGISDGPEDISYAFRALYDDTYLYIGVTVKDDVYVSTNYGRRLQWNLPVTWENDSVEYFFDGDFSQSEGSSRNALESQTGGQYIFGIESDDSPLPFISPEQYGGTQRPFGTGPDAVWYARTTVDKNAADWQQEARFKLSIVGSPAAKMEIGFNIAVDDVDTEDPDSMTPDHYAEVRDMQLYWTAFGYNAGEIASENVHENETYWGVMRFMERPGGDTNQTGTVTITSPLHDQKFPVGGKLAITARTVVTSGMITNVEYYLSRSGAPETKLGEATEAPFSVPWAMDTAGDFTLRAVARGDQGARIDSTPVNVTVFQQGLLTHTESFDTSLGTFKLELNNTVEPANFVFSNTRNAGGQPGELGGVVVRSTSEAPTAAGRMDLGGDFLLTNNDLFLKGKFLLRQQDFDGWLGIGFIWTDGSALSGGVVGLGLNEPGGGFQPHFRGFGQALSVSGPTFGIALDVVNEFCLYWSAKDKTLRGTVAGQAISVANPGVPADAKVNAVFAGSFNVGSASAQACEFYVDDFTYSLWESEQNAPPPNLSIARQGNSITLRWQGAGFRLQERTSLSSGAWADSSASVVSVGDNHTATIVPEGAARFYCLAK